MHWLRGATKGSLLDGSGIQDAARICDVCGNRMNTTKIGRLVVRNAADLNTGVFEIPECRGSTSLFATEAIRDKLESAKLSNLAFVHAGDLV